MKRQDRRVAKTKKSIEEAVLKLMAKKDYNSITITDIANEADINRKTFYNYYNNINDVMEEIETRIIDRFEELIETVIFDSVPGSHLSILKMLDRLITDNIEYIKLILDVPRGTVLFDKISDSIIETSKSVLINNTDMTSMEADLTSTYIMAGTIAVYRKYINEKDETNSRIVEKLTSAMSSASLRAARDMDK
ncbi:MAG: TetR/AcrR family transcriptional regulator [Clostridiales bacterium]|nr:TetR/AcrR family transcriptional regulator [Candidatus Crickella merdequi]